MKQTLADTAYEQLLEGIYSSELRIEDKNSKMIKLEGGDKIVEQQVIDILGISRTPVREAIRRLANDGLVDLCPGTFARVHTFTDKEKQDFGLVRLAIDTVSAPLVVLNGSNLDFQNLMAITTECQRAFDNKDIMGRLRLDFEFHSKLVSLAGNDELTNIQEQLTKRGLLMQIQAYNAKGSSFCDLTGHLVIIQALNERNTDACIRAMQEHLRHSYASTPANMQDWKTAETALNSLKFA